MTSDDLISVKQAAAILGVDRAIVYREKARGRLSVAENRPQGKMNRMRFRKADVEALKQLRDSEMVNV